MVTYTGSDGSPRVLTLAEIFRRTEAFEMGYNPNDSIEIRWGAPAGSAEDRHRPPPLPGLAGRQDEGPPALVPQAPPPRRFICPPIWNKKGTMRRDP